MMFRFKALQKMREPDELDSPSLLASPRGWIAVFVIMFVLIGAVVWSFAGSIPMSVSSSGLLTYTNGTGVVASPMAGQVRRVDVRPGTPVEANQPLADVTTETGGVQSIRSPFRGKVIGLSVSTSQLVDRGTAVATIERITSPDEPIVAMLFVPAGSAQSLRPGLAVNVSVPTAPAARFGLLRGTISSVSEFPLTAAQVGALVGGDLAARTYADVAAPHLVLVSLARDAKTDTGYKWTTATGPPGRLRSQIPVTASVTVSEQTPISLLFGR